MASPSFGISPKNDLCADVFPMDIVIEPRKSMNYSKELWPGTRPQQILVVDDELQVCDILSEALTRMGHEVVTAADGQEAVEKLGSGSFSVVITDMDMPRMDGMELIRHLVKHQRETDIIAITGHTMRYNYTDVVAAGASDFITKPFTLNELEAKLNRIIRERLLRKELERLAIRDPLTGLYNRRFLQSVLRKEAIRAGRYGHKLFLFFLDIDRFKDYNDEMGHQAGDEVLVQLARVLTSSLREDVDTAFRYGGDEFTAVLPHLPREHALEVADRIRMSYKLLDFRPTSLSIGIAQYLGKTGDVESDIEDMILRADKALYFAKRDLGGDRAHVDEESAS